MKMLRKKCFCFIILDEINANGWAPRSAAGEGGRAVELTLAEEAEAVRTFSINQVSGEFFESGIKKFS